MKTIRSDKNGRNIHSPFIYRLVANVIFAPYPFYAFRDFDLWFADPVDLNNIKIIFRIIIHFHCTELGILVKDPVMEKAAKHAKPDLKIITDLPAGDSAEKKSSSSEYQRLVLLNDPFFFHKGPGWPAEPEIWVIPRIHEKKFSEQFNFLTAQKDVQITIRLNQLGIVIFNPIFERQHYVIKH